MFSRLVPSLKRKRVWSLIDCSQSLFSKDSRNSKIVEIEYLPTRVTKNAESSLGMSIKPTKGTGGGLKRGEKNILHPPLTPKPTLFVHSKPRWPLITISASSRSSYEKTGHCEQPRSWLSNRQLTAPQQGYKQNSQHINDTCCSNSKNKFEILLLLFSTGS